VKILVVEDENLSKAKEHKIKLKNPWTVTNVCDINLLDTDDAEKEITRLTDLPAGYENMAALICNLLIGGKVNYVQ
jgi:hypothetical protein